MNNLHHADNLLRMPHADNRMQPSQRQAAQLEQYAKMLDAERATVLVLRDNIVELRTALDAVPLQEIMQYMHGTMYDPRANVDDYMPDDYDADRTAIDAWLRKELSA
jgi:hypothetical protein